MPDNKKTGKHKHVYSLQTGMCRCGKYFEVNKKTGKKERYQILMLCNRCGCGIVEYAPYDVGARCGMCGNKQFNHVVVPSK